MDNNHDKTWALVAAFLGFVLLMGAFVIGVAVAAPESVNPASIIVILLGMLATSLPVLINAMISARVSEKVDRVLNGEMDDKLQRNVHKVFDERNGDNTRT